MLNSIKLWVLHCTIIALFSIGPVYSAINELTATADCVCLGETVVYKCSVVGGLFTVWRGSVIDENCEITLVHTEFHNDGGPTADCNNGGVVGKGVSALNDCYVSRLSVEVTSGINGSTVECIRDDGAATSLVGSTSILITTSPAPPPGKVFVTVNNRELNFTWLSVDYSCPSLFYSFTTSQGCGECIHFVNSTTVSCSDFTASVTPNTCEFSVHSVICGNISGPTLNKNINLQVPDAPVLQSVPQYLNGRTRSLSKLITTFASGEPVSISDKIDSSSLYFNITYLDSTFSTLCGSVSIPASSCVAGTCSHTFDILGSSFCPPSTGIIVTAYASNVLGQGPNSALVIRDGINSFVDVRFSPEDRSIVCSFFNQPTATPKNCTANITYGENCDQSLGVYSATSTGINTATPPLETRADITDYCYVVTATSNNVSIMVEGILINIGPTSSSAAAIATAVTLTFIVLLIVIAAVVFIVLLLKWKVYQKSGISELPHCVTFSVGDKLSVSKAFGVFEECHIKLMGVNTEEITTGFKIIHVKCSCSSTTAQKLVLGLRAEGATNVNIRLSTQNSVSERAIQYLARDQVGALAGTFKVFTNMDLKISGVNVDHLGGGGRSTRVNYIKCFADDQLLESLKTTLKLSGITDVKCVNESDDTDQNYQILKITLPNESWSLNKTLKAFSSSNIDIHDVNVVHPAFPRDHSIIYTHYRMEIVATHKQFVDLSNALYSKGVATDVKEVKLSSESPHHYHGSQVDEDNFTPRTMMVEFFVRNTEGALANALKVFGELGINIFKINPTHMAHDYQSEFVGCSCEKDKKDPLLRKILSYGATEAEFLSQSELPPSVTGRVPNYCVVKCSVGSKLMDVLKAFPKMGVEVTTINPPRIKLLHQYVECCCADGILEKLLSNLRCIRGVIEVELLPLSEGEAQPDNYCVIKFSIHEEVGILFVALKAFLALKINVIGINTLKPAFKVEETHTYKHNHIVFVGTDEQEKELRNKLLATGLSIDVKPYELQTHRGVEVQVVDQVKTDDETKV